MAPNIFLRTGAWHPFPHLSGWLGTRATTIPVQSLKVSMLVSIRVEEGYKDSRNWTSILGLPLGGRQKSVNPKLLRFFGRQG